MTHRVLVLCGAALCLCAYAFSAQAQSGTAKPAAQGDKARPAAKPRSAAPTDPLAEVRRSMAVSLMLTLAQEARGFRDGMLAARVQARAADALWEADNERARELFRRAWETADATDRENLRRQEEERRKQEAATGSFAQISMPNLRAEVLRLSARRDRALGEEFLAKLDEVKKDNENAATRDGSALSRLDPSRPAQGLRERLQLAESLLAEGEVERALQFADPVLDRVTMQGLYFLSNFRQKNAKLADERYAAMLGRAMLDPATDANMVSLLSSYVFTPSLFITVEADGGVNTSRFNSSDAAAPDVPPAIRNAFLSAASQILLRPLPQPEQDQSTSGRSGLYFMIARLLPLFDQYMPQRSAPLRAQMAALAQYVPEDMRDGKNDWLSEGLRPDEESSTSEEQDALDIANRESDPAKRNQAYAQAALAAARRGDVRARDYSDKIDDTELRKASRAYVDYELVRAAIDKKEAEQAARLARTGEITSIQRVWVYTESAALLAKLNPARAAELLEEAIAEAGRIDKSSAEHARAIVSVATQMFRLNPSRSWEIMAEAIRAANSAEGFTGEDGRITARFMTRNSTSISSASVASFDLSGIFTQLAREDFNRAVEMAKEFKAEAPRAAATLAIARTVLNEKKK